MASDVIKELGKLEKQAEKQAEIINAVKENLKEEKEKYDTIITNILSLIRDENSGQEKMKFPLTAAGGAEAGTGKVHATDAGATGKREKVEGRKRLVDKVLTLPAK